MRCVSSIKRKILAFKECKVWVERTHRRVATSLDNRMGAGGFELSPSCFPSLKKKKALKQMY